MDQRSSSAFALFWNLCRNSLPDEVMSDFDDFFEECCMPRMDPSKGAAEDSAGNSDQRAFGDYSIQIGDDKFIFRNAERAPPAGVCGQNYSRSIYLILFLHRLTYSHLVDLPILSTSLTNLQSLGRLEEITLPMLVAISISAPIGFESRQLQIPWLCGDLQTFMEPACKTSGQQIPILPFCKQGSPS